MDKAFFTFSRFLADTSHIGHQFQMVDASSVLREGLVVGRAQSSLPNTSTLVLSYDDDPWYRRIVQRVPVLLIYVLPYEIRYKWWDVWEWFKDRFTSS